MEKKLNGIALLLFALLFDLCSETFQAYLYDWGIGVAVPWDLIALFIGIAGLVWVFCSHKKEESNSNSSNRYGR